MKEKEKSCSLCNGPALPLPLSILPMSTIPSKRAIAKEEDHSAATVNKKQYTSDSMANTSAAAESSSDSTTKPPTQSTASFLVQRLKPNAKVPTRGSSHAAGYDLYSCVFLI